MYHVSETMQGDQVVHEDAHAECDEQSSTQVREHIARIFVRSVVLRQKEVRRPDVRATQAIAKSFP